MKTFQFKKKKTQIIFKKEKHLTTKQTEKYQKRSRIIKENRRNFKNIEIGLLLNKQINHIYLILFISLHGNFKFFQRNLQ